MIKRYGFTFLELMVVVLIFAIIAGAIFAVLTTARKNWQIGQAQIELQQEVRKGIRGMVRELCQSRTTQIIDVPADGISYNNITFRIPEDLGGDGDVLAEDDSMEWGSQIQYSLGGLNNRQLLRTIGADSTVLANNITILEFKRSLVTSNILEVTLQAQKTSLTGHALEIELTSQVSLRN